MTQTEQTQSYGIEIKYRLTFTTPFHLGTSLRDGLIDRTVCRDNNNYLYVPGSSLKGALRERCEHLARLFELNSREPHHEVNALAEFNPDPDITYRIFGSRFLPGTLFFDDALMVQDDKELFESDSKPKKLVYPQSQQRTQVGMSRLSRTARSGFLYTSEFGLPHLRFEGEIYGLLKGYPFIDQPPSGPYGLLLLLVSLASLERLGGNTSTGAGQLNCEILSLTVDGESQQPKDWFDKLEGLEFYREERE